VTASISQCISIRKNTKATKEAYLAFAHLLICNDHEHTTGVRQEHYLRISQGYY
jgi:hypothetical protein